MTPDPVTTTLPGTRTDVLRLLVRHKLTGVPVVRKDGTLAGFVARKHLFAKPEEEQLAMVMVRDYPSVEADATIADLATLPITRQKPQTRGYLRRIEKLSGQSHHAVHKIALDHILADLTFTRLVR